MLRLLGTVRSISPPCPLALAGAIIPRNFEAEADQYACKLCIVIKFRLFILPTFYKDWVMKMKVRIRIHHLNFFQPIQQRLRELKLLKPLK
jgi:hypothetical protein